MTVSLIAELIAAGEVRKAELVELAGGLYTLTEVAAILTISEQLVEQRRKAAELIAIETREGYRYPACQFTPDGIVKGLSEVLSVMPIRADWMRLEWLLVPNDALEGISQSVWLIQQSFWCPRIRRVNSPQSFCFKAVARAVSGLLSPAS